MSDNKIEKNNSKNPKKDQRPWFKKKRYILLLVILIIGAGRAGSSGSSDEASTSSSAEVTATESPTESATPEEVKIAKIGDKVTEGDFAITVTNLKCGIARVGNSTFGATAQGQFCKVFITAENVGKSASTIYADDFKLISIDDKEFSPDAGNSIYLDEKNIFIEEINPGNSLKGVGLFDIPKGAELDRLTFKDGIFTSGVQVSLKK